MTTLTATALCIWIRTPQIMTTLFLPMMQMNYNSTIGGWRYEQPKTNDTEM